MSQQDITKIYRKLYPFTQVSDETKEKHIETIQNNLSGPVLEKAEKSEPKNGNTESKICPKCGGKLVIRAATRGENKGGQFYGCSNFPKCRFIKKI